MAGSKEGGLKAAATNRKRYDELYAEEGGFYGHIGRKGYQARKIPPGQLWKTNRDLAVEAGKKGGAASRRPRKAKA